MKRRRERRTFILLFLGPPLALYLLLVLLPAVNAFRYSLSRWDGLALSGVTLPATLTPATLAAAVVLSSLVGLVGSLWQSLAIARRGIVNCLGSTV